MPITISGGNNNYGIPISGSTQSQTLNPSTASSGAVNYLQPASAPTTGNVLGNATPNGNSNNYYASTPAPAPVVAPKPVLNKAAVDATQMSLDQLGGILERALAGNEQEYTNAENLFKTQETTEQGNYNKNTDTNTMNYDSNMMESLRAGVKSISGLLSILRGTGAEGWANNAVRDTVSSDIRTGLDTRNENQGKLDTTISSFLSELAGKRRANEGVRLNNEFAARRENATQKQTLNQDMAKLYSDAEDNATASNYLTQAGSLAPEIAKYSVAPVSAYDAAPVKVQAPEISAFGAPTDQSSTVSKGNNDTAGIFTIGESRKKLAGMGA